MKIRFLEKHLEYVDRRVREGLREFAEINRDFLRDSVYGGSPEKLKKVLKANNEAVINFIETNCGCYRQLGSTREYFKFYLDIKRKLIRDCF